MDLGSLMPTKEAVFLHLRHPITGKLLYEQLAEGGDDEKKPIGVDIVGIDSDEYAARERWLLDQRLSREEGKARNKRNATTQAMTGEDVQREGLLTIAACVKKLHNIELLGDKLKSTPEDITKFLKALPWAKEQIDEAMVDRSRFIKASPST